MVMSNVFRYILLSVTLFAVACNGDLGGVDMVGGDDSAKITFEVVEFMPAPGQFINEGYTATTMAEACAYAQSQLENGGLLSLGGFGGYVVVKLSAPIENSGGYDFGIYGNPFATSSEPGVVWVSCDANGNGSADDEWYELYGSESGKETTKQNYTITYSRTADAAQIAWRDSEGGSGTIERNVSHKQDYYPAWVEDEYTLTGTLLRDNAVWNESYKEWEVLPFEWGYADNFSTIDRASDKANRFRIDDAHTFSGEKVNLAQIDFVKVQSAINKVNPAIGETSTEVCGFTAYSVAK